MKGPRRKANRRVTDRSYAGEKTTLGLSILGWIGTFCTDIAMYESFSEMNTPKFWGIHGGQLVFFIVGVISARRDKS